jgi:hypothetical protein
MRSKSPGGCGARSSRCRNFRKSWLKNPRRGAGATTSSRHGAPNSWCAGSPAICSIQRNTIAANARSSRRISRGFPFTFAVVRRVSASRIEPCRCDQGRVLRALVRPSRHLDLGPLPRLCSRWRSKHSRRLAVVGHRYRQPGRQPTRPLRQQPLPDHRVCQFALDAELVQHSRECSPGGRSHQRDPQFGRPESPTIQAAGRKLIQHVGWADSAISPQSDIDYHEAATNVMGGSLETSENRENEDRTPHRHNIS